MRGDLTQQAAGVTKMSEEDEDWGQSLIFGCSAWTHLAAEYENSTPETKAMVDKVLSAIEGFTFAALLDAPTRTENGTGVVEIRLPPPTL